MCGENSRVSTLHPRATGSSPRVRGKLILVGRTVKIRGLIPACAGKTSEAPRCSRSIRAHPRVCGENNLTVCPHTTPPGSSPRVRGKLLVSVLFAAYNRLIPACAGKTYTLSSPAGSLSAHPRVCGENGNRMGTGVVGSGSSPRVRGKPQGICHICQLPGLIPACAGKTQRPSSPLWEGGLIPACAGKTSARGQSPQPPAAHPRVCGENVAKSNPMSITRRLIPACAGKTPGRCSAMVCARAHPRMCGENTM